MVNVWKIAPGSRADDWALFSRLGCIGIGWLEDQDFRSFKDERHVLKKLERVYGKNVPGYGKGAAEMIWSFVADVQQSDIVVANDAYNRVVGVGTVTSGYIAPDSPKNPIQLDDTTHRHHVRLIDWIVTKPADIPGRRFFVQRTLAPLSSDCTLGELL